MPAAKIRNQIHIQNEHCYAELNFCSFYEGKVHAGEQKNTVRKLEWLLDYIPKKKCYMCTCHSIDISDEKTFVCFTMSQFRWQMMRLKKTQSLQGPHFKQFLKWFWIFWSWEFQASCWASHAKASNVIFNACNLQFLGKFSIYTASSGPKLQHRLLLLKDLDQFSQKFLEKNPQKLSTTSSISDSGISTENNQTKCWAEQKMHGINWSAPWQLEAI